MLSGTSSLRATALGSLLFGVSKTDKSGLAKLDLPTTVSSEHCYPLVVQKGVGSLLNRGSKLLKMMILRFFQTSVW